MTRAGSLPRSVTGVHPRGDVPCSARRLGHSPDQTWMSTPNRPKNAARMASSGYSRQVIHIDCFSRKTPVNVGSLLAESPPGNRSRTVFPTLVLGRDIEPIPANRSVGTPATSPRARPIGGHHTHFSRSGQPPVPAILPHLCHPILRRPGPSIRPIPVRPRLSVASHHTAERRNHENAVQRKHEREKWGMPQATPMNGPGDGERDSSGSCRTNRSGGARLDPPLKRAG